MKVLEVHRTYIMVKMHKILSIYDTGAQHIDTKKASAGLEQVDTKINISM